MAKREFRFGIRNNAGLRAATWKIWAETSIDRSEVYLANRALGGTLKASLHDSGNWHFAYSPDAYGKLLEGVPGALKDRFIEKWPRPQDIAPGFTVAFRIVTPWSAATSPIDNSRTKSLIWIPNAPEQKATEISIIFTKGTMTPVSGWPGKQTMGTSLVGSFLLENHTTVWAVYCRIDMPIFEHLSGKYPFKYFKGRSRNDLQGNGLRMMMFGDKPDG